MAQSKRSAASYVAESRNTKKKNPFTGKTMAEMKKMWRGMTPAQRKANEKNFVNAAKTAPKAKPAPKASSSNSNGRSRFFQSSSGTRGQSRPSNSPGPAVVKQGSRTGASVDPRNVNLTRIVKRHVAQPPVAALQDVGTLHAKLPNKAALQSVTNVKLRHVVVAHVRKLSSVTAA